MTITGILENEAIIRKPVDKIPFFNTSVPAGFPSPAADYIEDRIDLNELLIKTPSATFFVKVEGESMIEAFIRPKALLVVDRSLSANTGDIVVAVINGASLMIQPWH